MNKESENKLHLTQRQLELIEKVGVLHSKEGMQPSSARITALLLISDKLELTFDEIRETLELSKSATSNGINYLLSCERVEYVTKPGDRKRYFCSNISSWRDTFISQFDKFKKFNEMMNEILEVRTKETVEFNNSIRDFLNFLTYLMDEMPKLFKNWENQKNIK